MLKVTNIQKSFNGHHVLKGIDFEINKGEVVAILGPSGSGKTTFLRCLNLLERPEKGVLAFTDGSLTIDFSKKISKADELKLRRRSSMVFQSISPSHSSRKCDGRHGSCAKTSERDCA